MQFKDIKMVVVDVDGTLTDGLFYVSDNGSLTKSFNTKDFWGLEQLQKAGLDVLILTGSTDKVIYEKVKQLPDYCKTRLLLVRGVEDKVDIIESQLRHVGMTWDNVAFIGDGGNDLEAMKKAAFTACPSDSLSIIKGESNYESSFPGGRGAVCEIAQYLLSKIATDKEID